MWLRMSASPLLPILLILAIGVDSQRHCFDKHHLCSFWASQGECTKNPKWMPDNCGVACRSCTNRADNDLPVQQSAVISASGGAALAPPVDSQCPRVQVMEILTRFVPTGREYRENAARAGCAAPNQPNDCAKNICYHKRFRTFDGSCNHLSDPMKGASYTPFIRLLPAHFVDGINIPFGLRGTLPSPRVITKNLLFSAKTIPTRASSLMTSMGQFIMHDISRNTLINTCQCGSNSPNCMNIPLAPRDSKPGTCIPFTRSVALCGSGRATLPRIPVNENTAFVDGSQIYGNDPQTANQLRAGMFLRNTRINGQMFPPQAAPGVLVVADDRAVLFSGLSGHHVQFLRLHNLIALQLRRLNPQWNNDRIYQEARRIVVAILQKITFDEWLPALLGGKMGLVGSVTAFNPAANPQVAVDFAMAAGRLHGMINEVYPLVDSSFKQIGRYRFLDASGRVEQLMNAGLDAVLLGLITIPARDPTRLGRTVTDLLFGGSMDMPSANIQRERDVGVQPYAQFRKLCNLPAFSFENWPEVRDPAVRQRVKELYNGRADDVDSYVGMLVEDPTDGSLIGPTMSCVFAEQMRRLQEADRFFFRNADVFTESQRKNIESYSMARLFCDVGDRVTRIPKNPFQSTQPMEMEKPNATSSNAAELNGQLANANCVAFTSGDKAPPIVLNNARFDSVSFNFHDGSKSKSGKKHKKKKDKSQPSTPTATSSKQSKEQIEGISAVSEVSEVPKEN